jgi:hypothetical protein
MDFRNLGVKWSQTLAGIIISGQLTQFLGDGGNLCGVSCSSRTEQYPDFPKANSRLTQ